jgi:hypothetical protein
VEELLTVGVEDWAEESLRGVGCGVKEKGVIGNEGKSGGVCDAIFFWWTSLFCPLQSLRVSADEIFRCDLGFLMRDE